MDPQTYNSLPRSSFLRRRSSSSPPPIVGDEQQELVHFSHPQHLLKLIPSPELFTCMGCKEYGAGNRFSCPQCDFQLHHFCALPPPSLTDHPLHSQHQLVFYSKPVKGGLMRSKCDICWKACKGYNFQCTACSFQMHPCCAMLSFQIYMPAVHPHPLLLSPPINPDDFFCAHCMRKRSGRVYRCPTCINYHIHAVCAKNMINGLHANGFNQEQLGSSSMIGAAARLASQVVIDFFGNLVEGFGEGVGQALVQNMVKGRCRTVFSRRRRRRFFLINTGIVLKNKPPTKTLDLFPI